MKRLFYSAVCAVLICLAQGCGRHETVKIVSYNVGTFTKYQENSMAMIADMMKEVGADAISMNELDSCTARTGKVYQLEEFAGMMGGWRFKFGPAMPYDGGAYGDGLAVSPDAGLVDSWAMTLPQAGGAEPRALVVMELEDYVVASTHLDHVSDSAQTVQAETINNVMKARYGDSDKPVFLCGDMNAVPGSQTMERFAGSWKVISSGTPTFPSDSPVTCIDYILALDNGARYRVIQSSVLQNFESGDPAQASDHLPVLAEIRL